jgi:Holliday junction resolvase RusA-like endonuclease
MIEPKPCSRPRVTFKGVYYSRKYTAFKREMKALIDEMDIELFEKKISIVVKFYMPIPRSLSKKKRELLDGKHCDVGGDVDNLLKSIFDSLNMIAFNDDKQIVAVKASKYYSFEPRIEIHLKEVE